MKRQRADELVPGLPEFVDGVPWGEYRCEYGDASQVPRFVLGLLDDSETKREDAWYDVYDSVWQKGAVYSASAPAVTALAMLVAAEGVPARARIIGLLAEVVAASGYFRVRAPALELAGVDFVRTAEEREEREVRAIRRAVGDALCMLRARLADEPDVEVRRALPYLLALCEDDAARPVLWERVNNEADAAARASALLGLAVLDERELPDGPEPVVRLAAAVSSGEVARVLDALDSLEALNQLPLWTDEDAASFVLRRLELEERLRVLRAVVRRPDADTREAAGRAARDLGRRWRSPTQGAVELLIEALHDEAHTVRKAALNGLCELAAASASAADALLGIRDEAAVQALARIRDPRVVPLLTEALTRPESWIGEALESAESFGRPLRDRIIELLPNPHEGGYSRPITQTEWLGALRRNGAPAVPAILELLTSGRGGEWLALRALRELGPVAAEAAPTVEPFLRSENELVRGEAACTIASITANHWPLRELTDAASAGTVRLAHPEQLSVLDALEALDDYPVERLEPFLEEPDERMRVLAAKAIWRITGEHRHVAGALLTLAGPTPTGVTALELLNEMPRECVAPLCEQLTHWRDTDERPYRALCDEDAVALDEHLRELAARALARHGSSR